MLVQRRTEHRLYFRRTSVLKVASRMAAHFLLTDAFPFKTKVLPVVVLTHVDQAIPLVDALQQGGIDAIEVTLRHPSALQCIAKIARDCPEVCIGAGTVTRAHEVEQVKSAGAQFGLSPGFSEDLHQSVREHQFPFIPGVFTPSEVMHARDLGYQVHKLFPAAQAGGVGMLRALAGPLPDIKLCPTGGVSAQNLSEFLGQPNVAMVGGTWIAPVDLIEARDWIKITQRAKQACEIACAI